MPLLFEETSLQKQEKRVREELGRELTSREKFYLALAEACSALEEREPVETPEVGPNVATLKTVLAPTIKRSRPLILCIDDDEAQLELRRQILENDGFLVLGATNARKALRILRETPVSLVVSDHMLRGTTGTKLAARMKKVKPDVPVVLYSGTSPKSL